MTTFYVEEPAGMRAVSPLKTLSDDEIRDLMGEVRVAFAKAHARSVDLRRQIAALNAELAKSTEWESTCLDSLNDLSNLLD